MRRRNHLVLGALLALAACSEDLAPEPEAQPDGGVLPSHVTTVDNGDGSFTTSVDATAMDAWIGFDFQSGGEAAESTTSWDLGFRRFEVKSNGGTSGEGGVEVAILAGADFATLARAPLDGWSSDTAEASPFNAGDGWYAYDINSHVLTPRDLIYVIRSAEGAYFKLEFTDYYDDAGTSGYPAFRWAPVDAPAAEDDALVIEAKVAGQWTYLSASAGVVTVSDPLASSDWDLAFSRTLVKTNTGANGPGLAGARLAPEGAGYAAIASATTLGYASTGLTEWFDYDVSTHVVTPRPVVFLVRTARGDYAKLQITGWDDGTYTLRRAPIARDVAVNSATVAATDPSAKVYFSLRRGEVVSGAEVASGTDWDLALSRTLVATNSGTSGPGTGGAADPAAASLADITSAASTTYAPDTMLPVPGPPGSGQYSGSPALAAWYDYDPVTHAVTPKARAYLVRTADGGHAKLQITSYAGGTLGFDWAYAGAGRDDFQAPGGPP